MQHAWWVWCVFLWEYLGIVCTFVWAQTQNAKAALTWDVNACMCTKMVYIPTRGLSFHFVKIHCTLKKMLMMSLRWLSCITVCISYSYRNWPNSFINWAGACTFTSSLYIYLVKYFTRLLPATLCIEKEKKCQFLLIITFYPMRLAVSLWNEMI